MTDGLRDIMDGIRSLFKHIQKKLPIWENTRRENISWLREQASELEKHKKNVDIATVAGTGIGMAGTIGGIAIISVVLAPVTFGASLALGLGLGSAAISIGGAATAIGAKQVKKHRINKVSMLEATRRLEQDKSLWDELYEVVQEIQNLGSVIEAMSGQAAPKMPQLSNEHSSSSENRAEFERAADEDASGGIPQGPTTDAGGRSIFISAITGVKMAREAGIKVALTAVRALGGAAIALGGVSLIVDTVTLVKTAKDIKAGSRCALAKKYREKADQLEKEKERIMQEFRGVRRYVDDALLALERALRV